MGGLIIVNNKANYGSGIGMWNSDPHILNVLISDNYADTSSFNGFSSSGGGLFLISSSPSINYSIITNNNASFVGGGLCAVGNSSPTISHSNFIKISTLK